MRTTVDIPDEQYAALRGLAARRGLRGYSTLVSEAVTLLLRREHDSSIDEVLRLAGSLDDDHADALEHHVRTLRSRPARTVADDRP